MLAAGAILMNADDPGNALVYARRAIQMDPLREDLYQVALHVPGKRDRTSEADRAQSKKISAETNERNVHRFRWACCETRICRFLSH